MSRAVAYFANGIGNLVMMMPALQAVASMTDEKKVDVCLGSWSDSRKPAIIEILKAWEITGKVIRWPEDRLDPRDYDLWFYSTHSSHCDVVQLFMDRTIPVPRPGWRESLIHETDHYMRIAYAMGYEGPIPKVNFPVADEPRLNGAARPVIGICNGYFKVKNEYWNKKSWPYFARLVDVSRRFFKGSMVGIGVSGEMEGFALDFDFAGKLSILQTAKVIGELDALVTTDTGNMHIADALGVPTVALFGPTLTSKNAPRSKKATVIRTGTECAPCQDTGRFMKCRDFVCMRAITVSDVMATLRERLKDER